jgi:hypothetical protein
MKSPMDCFLDGQNSEITMIRGAAPRRSPIYQGNALDAVFVSIAASQRVKARVKRAIFKEIANLGIYDELYGRGHNYVLVNLKAAIPLPPPHL